MACPSSRPGSARNVLIVTTLACALVIPMYPAGSAAQDDVYDATLLALELYGSTGIIRAPEASVDAIAEDLALIRASDPVFHDIHVFPPWSPGSVGVKLAADALAAYQAGAFTGFDEIFGLYPVDHITELTLIPWIFVYFEELLHSANLADEFRAVEGVLYAEPGGVAGDGSDITAYAEGHYLFKYGWGDCPAGCINNHYWEIVVSGGAVMIVDRYGDELPVAAENVGWDRLKSLFR